MCLIIKYQHTDHSELFDAEAGDPDAGIQAGYDFLTLFCHAMTFYPILFILYFEWKSLHDNISKLQHFPHFRTMLAISLTYDFIGRIFAIIYYAAELDKETMFRIIFVIALIVWILLYLLLSFFLLFLRNYSYNSFDYVKGVIDEAVCVFKSQKIPQLNQQSTTTKKKLKQKKKKVEKTKKNNKTINDNNPNATNPVLLD